MRERWILLDLDGPLLDVAERYHRLHCDLVARLGGRPLDCQVYWQAKRDRIPEAEILARAGLAPRPAALAAAARCRRMENLRYLRLDRPWPWTASILDSLALRAPLVLVTLRRHPDRLAWQLDVLGLSRRFARIVAGPGEGAEAKANLLRQAAIRAPQGSVFVGDTEVDICSGRALGLLTVALRCGIRSDAHLASFAPDVLLDDLRQLPDCLSALGWRP